MNSDGIVTSASSSKTQCPSGCCRPTSDSLARMIALSSRDVRTWRLSILASLGDISFMKGYGVVLVRCPWLTQGEHDRRTYRLKRTPAAKHRSRAAPQQSPSE